MFYINLIEKQIKLNPTRGQKFVKIVTLGVYNCKKLKKNELGIIVIKV
jgi:hypothetical protein